MRRLRTWPKVTHLSSLRAVASSSWRTRSSWLIVTVRSSYSRGSSVSSRSSRSLSSTSSSWILQPGSAGELRAFTPSGSS